MSSEFVQLCVEERGTGGGGRGGRAWLEASMAGRARQLCS